MDWKTLFLSGQGRIGQRDFWIAFFALLIANIVINNLGPLSILGIVLLYPAACVSAKRLHDFGKSGWIMVVPFGVLVAAILVAFLAGGAALLGLGSGGGAAAGAGALLGGGVALLALLGAAGFSIAFLIWMGTKASDPGDNLYGQPPVKLVTAF